MVFGGMRGKMKRKGLIAAALIVCATIVVVAVAIIRHVNNKQDAGGVSASEPMENSLKLVSSSQEGGPPLADYG